MDDDTTPDDERPEAPPRFLQRATPFLRTVSDALDRNPELRDTRDAIVREARDRLSSGAEELVRRADDVLARATAVEGTVVDVDGAGTSSPAPASAAPPRGTRFRASSPTSAPPRASSPHWTHGRLARMAIAAAREAARPARTPRWSLHRLIVGVLAAVVTLAALRRFVRRRARRRW